MSTSLRFCGRVICGGDTGGCELAFAWGRVSGWAGRDFVGGEGLLIRGDMLGRVTIVRVTLVLTEVDPGAAVRIPLRRGLVAEMAGLEVLGGDGEDVAPASRSPNRSSRAVWLPALVISPSLSSLSKEMTFTEGLGAPLMRRRRASFSLRSFSRARAAMSTKGLPGVRIKVAAGSNWRSTRLSRTKLSGALVIWPGLTVRLPVAVASLRRFASAFT